MLDQNRWRESTGPTRTTTIIRVVVVVVKRVNVVPKMGPPSSPHDAPIGTVPRPIDSWQESVRWIVSIALGLLGPAATLAWNNYQTKKKNRMTMTMVSPWWVMSLGGWSTGEGATVHV